MVMTRCHPGSIHRKCTMSLTLNRWFTTLPFNKVAAQSHAPDVKRTRKLFGYREFIKTLLFLIHELLLYIELKNNLQNATKNLC